MNRTDVRNEVLTELIALTAEHAAGHDSLRRDAEAAGAEAMRMRAESNQNAWLEVNRVLRFELARTADDPGKRAPRPGS
jgi:hypothetical protein